MMGRDQGVWARRTLGQLVRLATAERRCDAPRNPDSEVNDELEKLGWKQLKEREPAVHCLLEVWAGQRRGAASVAPLSLWATDARATGAAAAAAAAAEKQREQRLVLELGSGRARARGGGLGHR